MLGIIDYGMGNLKSVTNALNFLKIKNKIVNDPDSFKMCDKYILPGVGAFGMAINNIKNAPYYNTLIEECFIKKKSILGLCLGMQLFFDESQEHGLFTGLGFMKGKVEPLSSITHKLQIPHIGWNTIVAHPSSLLFKNIKPEEMAFYFVHSYYCKVEDEKAKCSNTVYGKSFTAAVEKENFYGCQFHPEKSQRSGLKVLANFYNQ
ncbi:MAG: imidazole glycerol phosphate synthase subunit HisH [Bacteroidetes bacterium]|nr:imidazole glycerol phosphate synthase subunit HisH [Bacteroidota bacterium]